MTFRLASILSLREAQLSESSHQVASIELQSQTIEKSRAEVEAGRVATRSDVAAPVATLAADLHLAANYLRALDREDDRLQHEAVVVRQSLVEARQVLVGRHQSVRVLQRLRDRMAEAAALQATRREQRALDEVAGARAHRRKTHD